MNEQDESASPNALADRLWSKALADGTGCWIWQAGLNRGYGRLWIDGRHQPAHRIAFELVVGPIPAGLELDHLCRRPACINPLHLEAVTHAENVRRGQVGENHRSKTHCPQGHKYAGRNLIQRRTGGRACRECKLDATRNWRERQRTILEVCDAPPQ